MKLEYTLDSLHVSVTRRWWMQLFAAFTRCLLGLAFIPPSIPKIMHQPFTALPQSNPVGHYFAALYQTGFYYEFLGWGQLIAALLLLVPRTSHIGAMLFLPIIANIAVLTASVGFAGTWLITLLMLLAATFLAAWEYDRLKPMFFVRREHETRRFRYEIVAIPALFAIGGVVLGILAFVLRPYDGFDDHRRIIWVGRGRSL
jgi:hypothetical protein